MAFENSALARYYSRFQPGSAAEVLGLVDQCHLKKLPALAFILPLDAGDPVALEAYHVVDGGELGWVLPVEPPRERDEDLVSRLTTLAADPDAPASVLVTHHVEEIPVGYSHALLLREGGVVAAGLLDDVLTDENLSKTFNLPLQVQKRRGRYTAWLR
jgi:hypothetical protein